jgi:holo-[acyl-carrier protein] synthase
MAPYTSKAMTIEIGVDIVEIERLREFAIRHRGRLGSVFTQTELAYCSSKRDRFPHLAARFAAKEAVFKALGTGWSLGLQWTEINVESCDSGPPFIVLHGRARDFAERIHVSAIHLSLSHCRTYAVAHVVIEVDQECAADRPDH